MTRLVLIHGSVTNAGRSWRRQAPLAERFELVAPNRPGFWPGPPVERVDFDVDAAWLQGVVQPGDHLVAHSYGGVAALLAAPSLPLRSLTVIEPPAFAVARGEPAVEAWLATYVELDSADAFLAHVGAPLRLVEPLPPDLRQGAAALLAERPPTEAQIPLTPLPYPVLVVTGGHEPAFEAVGDVLERSLHAERAVLPGAGHAAQNAPGFNETLVDFVQRAHQSDAGA
ncbi:MAG TPA: alpha/beta hydrolase [Gaiellaceae bacterium]|nr:alpha/beta hydrolase [Gaiellaceae bacterium]